MILWRWAAGPKDPVVISRSREEVEDIMTTRGYGVRPEWGKALELTDAQFEQLKAELLNGDAGH